MRQGSPHSFNNSIRYALLVVVFCVVNAITLIHAKFELLTASELRFYWMGRYGHFPFAALAWCERHFGGGQLAMRLPALIILTLVVGVVLLGLNQLVKRCAPALLIGGTLTLLAALSVQQYFSLKRVRSERRELSLLLNRVERASAPSEAVVADWNLVLPLYAYGSDTLRQQLRSTLHSFPDIPPVPPYGRVRSNEEMIYVGSSKDVLAQQLRTDGYIFREDPAPQPDASELIARYYGVAGASIYFVSPSARETTGAVSSKP